MATGERDYTMSAINEKTSDAERALLWNGVLGMCTVCGTHLQYPKTTTKKSLSRRSDTEMFLFKYDLLQGMQTGHLIDAYLSKLVKKFDQRFVDALGVNARIQWNASSRAELKALIVQAEKTKVPLCQECNGVMTRTKSEAIVVFFSMLKPSWFKKNLIPFGMLKGKDLKTTGSKAKKIHALLTFFTILPPLLDEDIAAAPPPSGGGAAERLSNDTANLLKLLKSKEKKTDEYLAKFVGLKFTMGEVSYEAVRAFKQGRNWNLEFNSVPDNAGGAVETTNMTFTSLKTALELENEDEDEEEDREAGSGEDAESSEPAADEILKSLDDDEDGDNPDSGPGAPAPGPPHNLVVKDTADMWAQFSLLKIVSHLMQWGATQNSRHNAVAIFWSGLYMWQVFLNESQRIEMPFEVWYVHVFRDYYSHVFVRNTWFSHTAIVLKQITNAYSGMVRMSSPAKGDIGWLEWVQKQLLLFRDTVVGVSDFVFLSDKSRVSPSSLVKVLQEKDSIVNSITRLKEEIRDSHSFFLFIFKKNGDRSLNDIFAWFIFVMGGEVNVNDYVWSLKANLRKMLAKDRQA